jgi:hypothetical protein
VRCLKLKPGQIARCPVRGYYKVRALVHAARAVRELSASVFAFEECMFVPIPGSKAREDPDYDDRLMRMLSIAFRDTPAQVRELLWQSEGTRADHDSAARLSRAALLRITHCAGTRGAAPRPCIVLVDDVLSSGKHFEVACTLLRREFPQAELCGLFLARVRRRSGMPADVRAPQ